MINEPASEDKAKQPNDSSTLETQSSIAITHEVPTPRHTVEGTNPQQETDTEATPFIKRALRWLTSRPSDFWTASATVAIAAFTFALIMTSYYQLREVRTEFQEIQRAQMILGNEKGQIAELLESNGKVYVVVYLRNGGRTPAHEVVTDVLPEFAPPTTTLFYAKFNPPSSHFRTGPTIGAGQPRLVYVQLDKPIDKIKTGALHLRIVGRVQYWDGFGMYCDPFAVIYNPDPPHFEPTLFPPREAVCNPATAESEEFSMSPEGGEFVIFNIRVGEQLSRYEIIPSARPTSYKQQHKDNHGQTPGLSKPE